MTHAEIIIDALRCKASKLRRKADKAQRDGRPSSHVMFLYDSANEVEHAKRLVEAGQFHVAAD